MEHLFKKFLATLVTLAMVLSVVTMSGFNTVSAKTKKKVNSVTVTNVENEELTLEVKETFTLKTEVSVTGKASKKVTYKSSNKKVAKVSSKGKITAKKAGTAKITVASKANKKKKVVIKVTVVKAAEQTSTTEQESGAEEEATDDDSNDQQQTEENLPAANFKDDDSKVAVAVKAPVGALPEGASMKVTDVDVKDVKEAVKDVVDADDMQAIDISFKDTDGKEIEPKKDVTVELTADIISKPNLQVVHIDDNGKATVVKNVKIDANKATITFKQDEFSTFVLTWTDENDNECSANIHWGELTDGTFTEFEAAKLDTTASSINLANNYDGYVLFGASYKASSGSDTVDLNNYVVKKTDNGWTVVTKVTNSNEETTTETVEIANNSDLYVYYAKKTSANTNPTSSSTSEEKPTPKTTKDVVDNGDGTFTITLDVEPQTITQTTQTGANVLLVLDTTYSMASSMTGAANRFEAARSAALTLIDTLDCGTNDIDLALVEFNSVGSIKYNWTKDYTSFRNYIANTTQHASGPTGTNWESGLYYARQVLNSRDSDNTYVIFLTDGEPNRRGTTTSTNANASTAVSYALTQAQAITALSNTYLYGVFCGSASGYDNLNGMINNAHGEKTINGTDSNTLKNEFASIAQTIVNNLGASGISVDDGVTELSSVSAAVSGEASGYKYYIRENGSDKFKEWNDAPGASYSADNGVTWDLSSAGSLPAGNTYRIEFTVWPSQDALDLVANLNNGLVEYDNLDDEIKNQIKENDGTYSLLTNTHLNTTYTYQGVTYTDANDKKDAAMELQVEEFSVKKEWNNDLDSRESDSVTLIVTKDKKPYLDGDNAIEVSSKNNWTSKTIYISCGFIRQDTQTNAYTVLENGHDYTIIEPENYAYYWDLTADVYRPMEINGQATMLILDDNATGTDGVNYYTIGGHKYKVSNEASTVLTATNDRRSVLDLKKTVTGENANSDDLFEYTATIGKQGEDDIWFSAQDKDGNTVTDLTTNATPEERDGAKTGYYYISAGQEFTFSIKADWNVRFINLPTGTEYSIEETDMAEGYEFVKAEATVVGDGTAGTVANETVSGTIDKPNTDFKATYTNNYFGFFYVYHSSDNTVEKISLQKTNNSYVDQRINAQGKFNIVNETKAGYIYGGYYQEYTDAGMTDDEIVAAEYKDDDSASYAYVSGKTGAKGNWITDSEGSPYTGEVATTWNGEKAYTDDKGTVMTVIPGTVYYLKEVPEAYLKPVVYFVYNISARDDNGEHYQPLEQMYFITTVDDGNYESIGLNVTGTDESYSSSTLKSTITIKQEGKTYAKIKAENTNSVGMTDMTIPRGYMAYWNVDKLMTAGSTYTVNPYFVTLDGVTVNSAQIRTAIIPAESTVKVNGVELKVLKRADLNLDSANARQDSTYK